MMAILAALLLCGVCGVKRWQFTIKMGFRDVDALSVMLSAWMRDGTECAECG
jgi:transcription elongation factor Elf1